MGAAVLEFFSCLKSPSLSPLLLAEFIEHIARLALQGSQTLSTHSDHLFAGKYVFDGWGITIMCTNPAQMLHYRTKRPRVSGEEHSVLEFEHMGTLDVHQQDCTCYLSGRGRRRVEKDDTHRIWYRPGLKHSNSALLRIYEAMVTST